MHTKHFLATALAGLAAASPIRRADINTFELVAIKSGSPIQNSNIHASGSKFWIGKPTATYCPEQVGSNCPAGDQTAVSQGSSSNTLSMSVVVPGGQLVYVQTDGQVGYTIAHSASIPQGALTSPFEYTPPTDGEPLGSLTFNEKSFSACPTSDEGVYQIYANVDGFTRTDCIGILMGTSEFDETAAWEYT